MQWILLLLGVILAVVAVFALQNPAVVNLRFLNLSGEASVLVVILIAYAVGVLSGILALIPSSVRKSARLRKLRSEVKTLEKQAASGPDQAKPSRRRFREVEVESTRAPSPPPAPPVEPERALSSASAAPSPSTDAGEEAKVADRAETAGSTKTAGSAETSDPSPEGESPAEGSGSGAAPAPDPDAEPPAGERGVSGGSGTSRS